MRPKHERFHDPRASRYAAMPYMYAPSVQKAMQRAGRELAPYWRALRDDKRFALPALECAARAVGLLPDVMSARAYRDALAAINCRPWPSHPGIPVDLFVSAGAHGAETDPEKIACYPTRADAARGREVVMSAGRFFAGVMPGASAADVQAAAENYAQHARPVSVHYATTADDWARVYAVARGFGSCMSKSWDADDPDHPVRFYAHDGNGLALAYLTHDGRADGETVARCIVNMERKKAVRCYGDARLARALDVVGFEFDGCAALDGVRCNAREVHGRLVAPYLDAVGSISWNGCADYCTIRSGGNYEATSTDGYADDGCSTYCDHCDERVHEDETVYSERHDQTVCEHCARRYYTWAYVSRGHRDLVRDDETVEVNGESYLDEPEVLDACGFVRDWDGDWQDPDDCIFLEYLGEYVLADNCTRLDIETNEGDEYARDWDVTQIVLDGKTLTVHEDYDGLTDEKIEAARKAARARVARRKVRAFSRCPGRRTNPAPRARHRVFSEMMEAMR